MVLLTFHTIFFLGTKEKLVTGCLFRSSGWELNGLAQPHLRVSPIEEEIGNQCLFCLLKHQVSNDFIGLNKARLLFRIRRSKEA